MLGFGRSARGCERPAIRLARIVLTLLPVMLLMPSVAVGCPSWSGVTAMKGTATTSFQGTASGSDNEGGTLVISLSRGGTVNVLFPKRVPPTGDGSTEFLGATGGGSLHVNDTSTDTFTSTAGSQSGDGPVVTSTTLGDLASVVLDRAACTYQLHIGFSVQTSTTGELPFTQDPGGGGFAITPVRPIPANLALVGAATVPVYSDCGSSGASPPGGCYGAALGLSGPSNWEGEYDLLKSCGSVVAAICNFGGQEGTASFSWNISPSISSAQGCSVSGGGVTRAVRLRTGGPLAHPADGTTCQQEQQKTSQKAKRFARAVSLVAGAGAIASTFLGVIEAFGPGTQIAGAVNAGVGAGLAAVALYANEVRSDPPDPNWRSIAKATPIGPTSVPAIGFLGATGASALDGVLRRWRQSTGWSTPSSSLTTARARHEPPTTPCGSRARPTQWVVLPPAQRRRSTSWSRRYGAAQSTLDVGFPGLAPPRIKRSEALVRAHGLPASFVRLARKYRVPGSLLAAATRRRFKSGAAPPSYATSSYGVLSYPPLSQRRTERGERPPRLRSVAPDPRLASAGGRM